MHLDAIMLPCACHITCIFKGARAVNRGVSKRTTCRRRLKRISRQGLTKKQHFLVIAPPLEPVMYTFMIALQCKSYAGEDSTHAALELLGITGVGQFCSCKRVKLQIIRQVFNKPFNVQPTCIPLTCRLEAALQ